MTTEQGTGIVHCAPSHGPDDFNLCLKAGIKAVDTIDDNGQYTNNIIKYKGLHIFKANTVLIEDLKKQKKINLQWQIKPFISSFLEVKSSPGSSCNSSMVYFNGKK